MLFRKLMLLESTEPRRDVKSPPGAVYASLDKGGSWFPLETNIPTVPVMTTASQR